MFFVVQVIVVEVKEHFRTGGGRDPCADDAFNVREARKESRGFRMRELLGLLKQLCWVECAPGGSWRGKGRGEK